MRRRWMATLTILGVLALAAPALAASPDAIMEKLQKIARSGDAKALQAMTPSRGLKTERGTVKRKQMTRDFMLAAEFLKTARREVKASCGRWKHGKARCDLKVDRYGGHSYWFKRTKSGAVLIKTLIYDG